MKRLQRRLSPSTVIATVALLIALGGSAVVAQAGSRTPLAFTTLVLQNGWKGGPFGTGKPAVAKIAGVVVFKGAMGNPINNNPQAFTLPAAFRPSKSVFLTVDQANATVGRIDILSSGVVTVEAETTYAEARTFTSLDGVSFAP